jgi:hypothetical protein
MGVTRERGKFLAKFRHFMSVVKCRLAWRQFWVTRLFCWISDRICGPSIVRHVNAAKVRNAVRIIALNSTCPLIIVSSLTMLIGCICLRVRLCGM